MSSAASYDGKTSWASAGPMIKLPFLLSPRLQVWSQDISLGITGWWDSEESYPWHLLYSLIAWWCLDLASCLYNGKSAHVHKDFTERRQVKPYVNEHSTSLWEIAVVAGKWGQMLMNNVWRYGSSGHLKLLVRLDVGYPLLGTSRNVCNMGACVVRPTDNFWQ